MVRGFTSKRLFLFTPKYYPLARLPFDNWKLQYLNINMNFNLKKLSGY